MDDAVPTTSKAGAGITSPSPPRKRKQLGLGHLSLAEKQAILNLYKKSLDDEPTLKTVQLVSKIAMTLGVAKSTVYRAIKQYKSTGRVSTSKHCGGRLGIVTCLGRLYQLIIARAIWILTRRIIQKIVKDMICP